MKGFSGKSLRNNIVMDNRKFHWQLDYAANNPANCIVNTATNACYRMVLDGVDNLAVIPAIAGSLPTANNLLNGAANFVATYFNGGRDAIVQMPESTTGDMLNVAAAFDEGGNFIDVRYGPLTPRNPTTGNLYGNYRVSAGSAAAGFAANLTNSPAALNTDKAGNPRPGGNAAWTAGAYNVQ
jgi:hypothetical protein